MDNKGNVTLRTTLLLLLSAALLSLLMPGQVSRNYNYLKGRQWTEETLYAAYDFPIYKTDEQLREEREEAELSVVPYYRYSDEPLKNALKAVSQSELGDLAEIVSDALIAIYDKGIVTDEGIRSSKASVAPDLVYVQKGKRASKCPADDIYTLSVARAALLDRVLELGSGTDADSLLLASGIYNLVVPNLSYDEQTTVLVGLDADSRISPTSGYVSKGQLIVAKGEIVTSEIAQMLDSYTRELKENVDAGITPLQHYTANGIIALLMVVVFFFGIFLSDPGVFSDRRLGYLLVVFLLFSAGESLAIRFDEGLVYILPLTLCALLMQPFFKPGLIIPVYAAALMPLVVFHSEGPALFTMFFVAGIVSVYMFRKFDRGWRQFVVMAVCFLILTIVYFGFGLLNLVDRISVTDIFAFFIAALLSVFGYPLLYLLERIFNMVSKSRLQELCDTSSQLLRQLEKNAPGTFQHSLAVVNMADAAARAIGADPLLVRAGALYHDIGKMENPLCFVENESLITTEENHKYHSVLSPRQSALDIARHVTEGREMARKAGLPSVVTDFISTHHGDSLISYFWSKHLSDGGDPSAESDFHYSGPRPQTKEQVVLMLCDSFEAASRTLPDYSREALEAFVNKIVKSKMDENQFSEADITVREISLIKDAVASYLSHIHHERIKYPEREAATDAPKSKNKIRKLKQYSNHESSTEQN